MAEYLEFSALIKREGDRYRVTCPEIGISLTSSDQVEALEVMQRWAHRLVDPLIVKDLENS
jgi:hypothetical protein